MIRKCLLMGLVALISLPVVAQRKKKSRKRASKEPELVLNSAVDSASYAIGLDIAKNLKANDMDSLNFDLVIHALKAGWSGDSVLLTQEQCEMSISDYLQKMKAEKLAKAKAAGEKFLAENKTKPGVITTASGLQYQVLKEGTGPKPTLNSRVKTHYTGMLLDGTKFDSSVDRGEPITFPVTGVIKGWTEALQLMPVGSKWRLFIPSDLAYGDRGAGGKIKPGDALIFEVELLEIVQ
ncbi:peptidylprolyl isomerase [Chitinophaga caeni]|uniref:Peptidyl-prolyl cis-trans isomerase n=1 Tax=Chitinophaga caeni TaxID=2029983 RepID=A0A291QUW1_9BACT|nr:FKBP-type peptidyl-prolyl cis-trans isomerase [Chitinophaga caeni]ATL47672.1 peptidylprolyl isomerase [Chitinophaga caeni]